VSAEVLERLRALLRAEGGLIATLVDRDGGREAPALPAPSPAAVLADAPRTSGRPHEYQLLVEAIYEGYLLHYGRPRVVRAEEADLSLLAGDRLYAIGLARLVALGDTLAVAELADTITLCALAHGAGDAALAEAVWAAGRACRRLGSERGASPRQGPRARGCAGGTRCNAHNCRAGREIGVKRASISLTEPCPTSTPSTGPNTPPTA
jgi:hypothetical protein